MRLRRGWGGVMLLLVVLVVFIAALVGFYLAERL